MRYAQPDIDTISASLQATATPADLTLLRQAYAIVLEKTAGKPDVQHGKRLLIEHLLKSAQIVANLKLDTMVVIAALLHHRAYEEKTALEKTGTEFGKEVKMLIEDLALISDIEQKNYSFADTETLSHAILATPRDIRAIFLKLATTTERMRVIGEHEQETQVRLVSSALNIYAPIAHKLGLQGLKWELEDYSLKVLSPKAYAQIKEKLCVERSVREKELAELKADLENLMNKTGFSVTVYARLKHFYSIYKKMQAGKQFSEIDDLRAARIICDTTKQCYEILGVLHAHFQPLPRHFHDYIAIPKSNGYKSIHTTFYWNRKLVEVQIRTWDMHFHAETGVPAHWRYKQYSQDKYFDHKLSWTKQLVEWQHTYPNAQDFLRSVKLDFGKKQVFAFTPQLQVIVLPERATPIDFAFAIHSDIGLRCKQAKVNKTIVPLTHHIRNGDIVDITTAASLQAKRSWLLSVQSRKAIGHIKKALGIATETTTTTLFRKKNGMHKPERLRLARCCNPIPSDTIAGYKTAKRKITIHRSDCNNLAALAAENLVAVDWDQALKEYHVGLEVNAQDRPGLLNDILSRLAANKAAISTTHTSINKNNTANCEFEITVSGLQQLEKIIREIEHVHGIYTVTRK